MKRLLSADYEAKVIECFTIREEDFLDLYTNFVNDHIQDNPDIFDKLKLAINRTWEAMYNQYPHYEVPVVLKDGSIWPNPDKIEMPTFNLKIKGNLYPFVSKAFFNKQLATILELEKAPGTPPPDSLTLEDVVKPKKLEILKAELLDAKMINDSWKWIHKPVKNAAILLKSLSAWDYSDRDLSNIDVNTILKNTFKINCSISTVEHQEITQMKTDFYKHA